MFGQTQNTFGASNTFGQSGGFGATSTPFGATSQSSAFGAKTGGGFGTTAGFGQSTPAAAGGTGIFGGAGTSATSTAGGLFGNTNANNTFGQTQAAGAGGAFTFGQSNQSQAGTLFGTNTNTQSNLFSTPTSNAAFGSKTPATGGLFGNTGTSTGTSLFGNTQTQATGGMFGGATFGAAGTASSGTVVKFNPPMGQDTMLKSGQSQNINTKHICICAMKEYDSKSMEELRCEDYAANRKGPQSGAGATATGMFGQSSTPQQASTGFGTGLFGQQTQNKPAGFSVNGYAGFRSAAFGNGGCFGPQPGAWTFGVAGNKPLFGFGTTSTAPASSSGGLFGTNTASGGLFSNTGGQPKSLFGTATTTSANTFGGFGTTTGTTSLFGQNNQPKPAGGLFGQTSTTQAGGLFGNTQTSTAPGFGGFGTTTNTGFGQTPQQTGGLFGNKPAGFGTATTNSGFSFGGNQQTQSTGLFGQKPATTGGFNFNSGATTGGFGATQPQAGGLFGNKTAGFGTNTFGGFGTGNTLGGGLNTGTGLFGQQTKPNTLGFNTGANTLGGFGTTAGMGQAGGLTTAPDTTAQNAQLQQQILLLANDPYGDLPIFKNLKQTDRKKEELLKPTNPAAQKAALSQTTQYKVSPRPTAKIKPRPIHSLANGKAQLFEGLEEDEASTFGNDTFQPRRSIKKLVINPNKSALNRSQLSESAPSPIPDHDKQSASQSSSEAAPLSSLGKTPAQPDFTGAKDSPALDTTIAELNRRTRMRKALEESRFDSTGEEETFEQLSDRSGTPPPHPTGVTLRRSGYYMQPPLEDLELDDNGDCIVTNLLIGREGYGNVLFPGDTSIANLNLDEIVYFRRKEITIYPDDDSKPEVGEGLNRHAQVTLDCVWPTDKSTREAITDPKRLLEVNYTERLERASAKIGAKFVDYLPETGSWVFEVKHFSKYGLVEDSDDEDVDPKKQKLSQGVAQKPPVQQPQKPVQGTAEAQKQALREKLAQQAQQQKLPSLQTQMSEHTESQSDSESASLDGHSDVLTEKRGLGGQAYAPMQDDSEMADITRERMPSYQDYDDSVSDDEQVAGQVPSQMAASHSLAMRLGVRAEELQIRKASFFGDEEDEQDEIVAEKAGRSPFRGFGAKLGSGFSAGAFENKPSPLATKATPLATASPRRGSPNRSAWNASLRMQSPAPPLSPFSGAFSSVQKGFSKASPKSQHVLIPSGLTEAPKARRVVGTRVQRGVVTLKDSVIHERQRCISDMGLYQGRKFRAGWGPGWSLVHAGRPLLEEEDEEEDGKSGISLLPGSGAKRRLNATPYVLALERVHMAPHMIFTDSLCMEHVEKLLDIQLKNSDLSTDDLCPFVAPCVGVSALHAYAEESRDLLSRVTSRDFPATSPEERDVVRTMSDVWELCAALWGDLPQLAEEENNSYKYHMVRREEISKWLSAVSRKTIQHEVDRYKAKAGAGIGAVLALLSGRQVAAACAEAAAAGEHRLALLVAQAAGSQQPRQLLQQQLANWRHTKADEFIDPERLRVYALLAGHMTWPASHMTINSCHGLDWRRSLALHLWYACPSNATISEALHKYMAGSMGGLSDMTDRYAAPPLPAYLQQNLGDQDGIQDICFHLLQLYADSWHLGQVLRALEYSHLSDYHHASLCSNYAAQLESLGLWHWAVFVLLHITDPQQREAAVREVLTRCVELDSGEEQQAFVQNKLGVPAEWIHHAKAVLAGCEGRRDEQAWHLLKAGEWHRSHDIIVTHIASNAIINEHYDYLKRLLCELSSPEHAACIAGWATGGKVYLDFITMTQTIRQLKQAEPSAYALEQLHAEVTSLANRVSHLACNNAKDRLCQSEMAKRVANVMRTLLSMQHPNQAISARLLAPTISQLPMPEDYALQELRQLTRHYMLEVTMS